MRWIVRLLLAVMPVCVAAAEPSLAERLAALDTKAPAADAKADQMLAADVERRFREAAVRENDAWAKVKTRAEWESFRDARIKALRDSLNLPTATPRDVRAIVTGTINGDGYRIEKLCYETRPGLVVTANLYLPANDADAKRPAFLISHSHHAPKTQSELQDMGINWARVGCAVLVPDHLGHGERRTHPFPTNQSYPKPFRAGRQDYFFRYNTSRQLHLAGESLMGWMVWDLMRGVDVLLARGNADPSKIILIGGVAGGGDPAGVTAALDNRVAAAIPFNFGGPQPDYPIPPDAERDFGWFGEPYWESTRCLKDGAAGGFAHWTIVASVAPRRLVYAHEFAWDKARDPAWPRITRAFDLYDAAGNLTFAHGTGNLKGQPPESSHCGNVGDVHRKAFYAALQKWFGIAPPAKENATRYKADELACLTPAAIAERKPRPLHDLVAAIASAKIAEQRRRVAELPPDRRAAAVRDAWRLAVNPGTSGRTVLGEFPKENFGDGRVKDLTLSDNGIVIRALLLLPKSPDGGRRPLVVHFAQAGLAETLKHRSTALADLLSAGVAVCLADLRGTGATAPGRNRGRNSGSTSLSQAELMLGGTVIGRQLGDLRSLLQHLRTRTDIDTTRVAVWGDSVAPANAADAPVEVPIDADPSPKIAEPGAALLARLAVLFDDRLRAAQCTGGLASHLDCLKTPFLHVPHDAIVPNAASAGDIADITAAVAARPVRADGTVDGLNRRVPADAPEPDPRAAARWLIEQLK